MRYLVAALLSASIFTFGQTASSQRSQDVVERLMPDGLPSRLVLPKPAARDAAVHELKKAQATARGTHAQRVAFLLAALEIDYARNRDYLLWVLSGCQAEEIKRGCDDLTPEYLTDLYGRGHPEILAPLLKRGLNSYSAAGSEFLGDFAATVVAKAPSEFIDAIRTFPAATQSKICYFAGTSDGGGMAPSDLDQARKRLSQLSDPIARHCLREIERANNR
jgi:hypothetical protein